MQASPPNPEASGPFEITNRSVLRIAVPMTLAYLSTPLLGVVDTAVIGRLGSAALIGGIALGGIVFDLVFASFNFLRSGTTGLTAQALGAGNRPEIAYILLRALILAVVAGFAAILLQVPMIWLSLTFLGGTEEVRQAAATYFEVRIYSAPFALANYAILGWLLGLGRAGAGLAIQMFLNGLNIILSIVLVLGLEQGIEGVALATVISEVATAVVGGVLVIRSFSGGPAIQMARVLDMAAFRRVIAVNRDIMIRTFSILFAFAFFTARSADQGDTVLAANVVLYKFIVVAGYFLDGFATAAEQIAGRAVGARYRPAFDRAVRLTLAWGYALALAAAVLFWFAGPSLIDLLSTNGQVRAIARIYLPWAAMAPLIGVLAYQMDGIFIGATWSKDMRNMMLLSLAAYLIAYPILFPLYGNHGLWAALMLFLGARGITLMAMCRIRANHTFAPANS